MSCIVRQKLYLTVLLIPFLFACVSPDENTPFEVVKDFLGKIQFLAQPIYDNRAEIRPEEISKYDRIRREVPGLFESRQKGQTIMMGFLFGTFDSFEIISEETYDGKAIVEAEIKGSRFLGITSDGEEATVHHVTFRLVKRGRRWYISDLSPLNEK